MTLNDMHAMMLIDALHTIEYNISLLKDCQEGTADHVLAVRDLAGALSKGVHMLTVLDMEALDESVSDEIAAMAHQLKAADAIIN